MHRVSHVTREEHSNLDGPAGAMIARDQLWVRLLQTCLGIPLVSHTWQDGIHGVPVNYLR